MKNLIFTLVLCMGSLYSSAQTFKSFTVESNIKRKIAVRVEFAEKGTCIPKSSSTQTILPGTPTQFAIPSNNEVINVYVLEGGFSSKIANPCVLFCALTISPIHHRVKWSPCPASGIFIFD